MKYILLLVLGLGITLGSCQKFLEEIPTGSLTDQSQITSAPGGIALATGAYRALPTWTNGAVWWGGNLMGALEYNTGKAYSQYQASELWKFETDVESGDSQYFTLPWNNWYRGVRDCNLAIKMIPGVTGLSAAEKSKYLGEVRTLRAFYYFCLVRQYGDVVYNTSVLTDVNMAAQPRTSLKTIYDKIIVPDLEFAVNESGLVDEKSTGRVTKHVARAVLADVYLTMAGYPYQEVNAGADTTKQWCTQGLWTMTGYPVNNASAKDLLQKAKTQLDFLYGQYPIGDFSDLNNPAMDNKGGAIFQIQYLAGTTNNGVIGPCLPLASQIALFDENGTVIPSLAYHASFAATDKRIQDRVYFFYNDTKSTKYDASEVTPVKFPIPCIYKYYDKQCIKVTGQSGLNFNLYRYADVLLMLTEVNWSLRQLGVAVPDADIVKGINEVRARAGVPTYTASGISLLNIMSERAYELIFESKMLWDMRRTRLALVDGVGQFTALVNLVGHQPTNFNFPFTAKHLLSPVSSTEIDNNRLCLQNFGWSPKQVGQ
ncbi:MAG: RagB/SusD family nutrient uptake outer membrane protein [Bacteroidetes bacterium]|nr:RagB/SusD family nutrient uptake outer membrane protein [Bacteroidota bacterium]